MTFDPKNTDHKKQLYTVLRAMADLDPNESVDTLFDKGVGTPVARGIDYMHNVRKGQFSSTFATLIHQWLEQHHFATAHRFAPDIFPQTPSRRWRDILHEQAIEGQLTIQMVPNRIGIVQRESQLEAAGTTIALGQRFCVQIDSEADRYAILLQGYGDDWQVIEIGPDMTPAAPIRSGINRLPLRPDRQIDPLAERSQSGVHDFVMVMAAVPD